MWLSMAHILILKSFISLFQSMHLEWIRILIFLFSWNAFIYIYFLFYCGLTPSYEVVL